MNIVLLLYALLYTILYDYRFIIYHFIKLFHERKLE